VVIEALFGIITYAAFHLGHHRGLVGAAFGFFGWLLAFIFAIKLTPWGTGVIDSLLGVSLQINPLIAFVILGFIGWRIVQSIGNSSTSMVESGEISVFNRLAGGALYWVVFMLTFSLVLRAGTTYKVIPSSIVERSRIYNQMLSHYPDIAMKSLTYLIPFIADGWGVLDKAISDIDQSLNEARPARVLPALPEPPAAPPTPSTVQEGEPKLNSLFDKKEEQGSRRFREPE
jgi:uncharacterized membrane protein required for colicin V production